MPEVIAEKTVFSLAEVARSIQKTIAERYTSVYWIRAEMNKLNYYSHSGHCYPELVEKKDGRVVAEMRSVLWKSDYQRINQQFLQIAREPLKNGIGILFQASISYDPVYGMSLRIHDIDPAFSLGVLEREKQESIDRLKDEGLFQANKQLPFPLLPKRIAIISVETSKGLSDFLKIIDGNPWHYRFEHLLFPALLQGEKAVSSITARLEEVARRHSEFDAAAIIRGGGGEVGLTCYNHYLLASAIARFPIPVLTGIGHSTNETVSEMVAYKNAITPTELADFLIQQFHNVAVPLQRAEAALSQQAQQLIADSQARLDVLSKDFRRISEYALDRELRNLQYLRQQLRQSAITRLRLAGMQLQRPQQQLSAIPFSLLRDQQSLLNSLQRQTELLDPQRILNRGYSITSANGRPLTQASAIQPGDLIETRLSSGRIISTVTSITPDNE